MDSSNISSQNHCYSYNCDMQAAKMDSVNSDPMMMADAREAAEDIVGRGVDAVERAGGDVNSPEFRAMQSDFTRQLADEILQQSLNNVSNFAGSERSKKNGPDQGGGEASAAGDIAGGFADTLGANEGTPLTDGSSLTVGASGGSIFERIALALGTAMEDKVKQLLQAAEAAKSAGEEGVLLASAQVTARGQELNLLSQAFNSTINSVGQATSTAARKQ